MELTKENMLDTISGITKDLDGVVVDKDNDTLAICKDGERLITLSLQGENFPLMLSEYTFPNGKTERIISVTYRVDYVEIERFSMYLKCLISVCDKAHRSISDFILDKSRTDEEIAEFMRDVNKTARKEYMEYITNLDPSVTFFVGGR